MKIKDEEQINLDTDKEEVLKEITSRLDKLNPKINIIEKDEIEEINNSLKNQTKIFRLTK